MSSTMTVMPSKHDQKGLFGGAKSVPVWLQFVPGTVAKVNTSSVSEGGYTGINSILAVPDVVDSSDGATGPKV